MSHDWGSYVRVWLDSTWNHDFSGGIDRPTNIIGDGARSSHRDDLFPLNRNVPIADTPRCYNLASTNHQV
jgi:hypothetical protein